MSETVLVTGASSGIGASLAGYLSERYSVVAVARRTDRMAELYGDSDRVVPYGLDLSETDEVRTTLGRILDEHGPIPYVINNAGVNHAGDVLEMDGEEFHTTMGVNAFAPMVVLQELLPGMLDAGFGRVINVTSGAPLDCPKGAASYSASKAALNTMTVIAAKEHEGRNVKINLMSPGPCRTEMAPDAPLEPSACHPTVDYLLELGEDGPTGRFFWLGHEVPLFPDLDGVEWEAAEGVETLRRVI